MATDQKASAKQALEPFSAPVRRWFENSFEAPTPAQAQGWPAISSGAHTLICAPTGSGKTLAAFMWGIDRLASEPETLGQGVKIVYVSPLKALSYDIERNLRAPLQGIKAPVSVGLRTGDTPQNERRKMLREPPDILITTPESLYLMISSGARDILGGVEAVIVDEIHSVAQSKRGAHLAVTLERLEALQGPDRETQRIGLSATQRPLETVAGFLVGPRRKCEIVDAGRLKELDLQICVPVEDMTEPSANVEKRRGGSDSGRKPPKGKSPERIDPGPIEASLDSQTNSRSIWPSVYPELLRLVREHTSTIIFVNNRRGAERLAKRLNELANDEQEAELPATEHAGHDNAPAAGGGGIATPEGRVSGEGVDSADRTRGAEAQEDVARAHHGSLSHEERANVEELLKSGQLPCIVATSSLELGIDMGALDLVIQVESPKSVTRGLQRIGRAGHGLGEVSKGRIFPKFRADLLECAVVARRMREGEIEETVIPSNPLDVLAQHLVAMAATETWEIDEVEKLITGTDNFRDLSREQLENVLDMLDGRYPSDRFAELRPRIVWDRAAGKMRGRPGARQLAIANAGTIPDRGLYGVHLPDGRRVGELDEEMVYEARPGQTFLLGASTWRIEEITRDRVIVTPAPGAPGAVPFWRGDGIGRPSDLGRAIGAFSREAVSAEPEQLAKDYDLDPLAASNLV
ncbi:MAG: DEAD/DEAH box helicase, partial [Solirubrobacterales bacterium]